MCKSLAEFKDKLKTYEKIFNIKNKNVASFQNSASESDTKCYDDKSMSYTTHSKPENKLKNKNAICYNCSEMSHASRLGPWA